MTLPGTRLGITIIEISPDGEGPQCAAAVKTGLRLTTSEKFVRQV